MNNTLIKIILVDDDEDDRLFFKDAIDEIGMNTSISFFKNGQEFLDHLKVSGQPLPHIVFLDLNMPVKNGYECLEEIRSNERLKDMTVAIYSTSSSDKDVEETFIKGANVYINKPNDFDKLKKIIKKVLELNWQYHTSNLNKENFLLSI